MAARSQGRTGSCSPANLQLPEMGPRAAQLFCWVWGFLESSRALISLTWPDFFPLLSGIPMQCFLFFVWSCEKELFV